MPLNAIVVRPTDEFATHAELGGNPRIIMVTRLTPGQFGNFIAADSYAAGAYDTEGAPFEVVEIDG